MKISEILKSSDKPFASIEIVPPLKGIRKDELLKNVGRFMDYAPKYINVTSHRDDFEFVAKADGTYEKHLVRNRISEISVCSVIREAFDVEVVPHLICGGVSKDEIESKLYNMRFLGFENVLALRGDCLSGEKRFSPQPDGYAYASELVEGIRKFEAGCGEDIFSIGVGAYPEKHFEAPNLEMDIANLKKKVDAGADYVITQMFFDNEVFYEYERRCREAGINVPIIPGLKPLSTPVQINRLPEAFSIDIPNDLASEVSTHANDRKAVFQIGTEWCRMQCRDLIAHGVPAVHFYTMGNPDNVTSILKDCF